MSFIGGIPPRSDGTKNGTTSVVYPHSTAKLNPAEVPFFTLSSRASYPDLTTYYNLTDYDRAATIFTVSIFIFFKNPKKHFLLFFVIFLVVFLEMLGRMNQFQLEIVTSI